jgi:hypothetical protein
MTQPGSHMLDYARAIDTRDWAAVTALFRPDGVVEGTRWSAPVPEYLSTLFSSLEPFSSTMHAMHNQYVEHVSDDVARVVTYCVAYHVVHGASDFEPGLTVGVIYNDELRREDGAWAIAHRRTELKWKLGEFLPT